MLCAAVWMTGTKGCGDPATEQLHDSCCSSAHWQNPPMLWPGTNLGAMAATPEDHHDVCVCCSVDTLLEN
jgi:hypothetical protein